ncbi:hypothetical protein AB0H76_08090 [Nocardia sp. NPDC050712]|uniref:hypothetical protein n=1 Tax=Nocardia sp. NPDC050712 TaxID=3155518 RepID=UPI0033C59C3B
MSDSDFPQYPTHYSQQPPPGGIPSAGGRLGSAPQIPRMPGTVRAAQVISFVMAGLGVALTVLQGVVFGAERAGGAAFGFLCAWILAALAVQFGSAGPGTRTAALTLSIVEALIGLGGMAAMQPPGLLGILVGIVTACLVGGPGAAAWFARPRPGYPAG